MPDREKVIKGLECCKRRDCNNCPYDNKCPNDMYLNGLIDDVLDLLKELQETIRNLEQEIRDKNERLKERAEQVDSMLKERKPVEPSRDIALNRRCPKCFAILKGKFCHQCGQAVKWDEID